MLIEKNSIVPCQEFRYALLKKDTHVVHKLIFSYFEGAKVLHLSRRAQETGSAAHGNLQVLKAGVQPQARCLVLTEQREEHLPGHCRRRRPELYL